MIETEVWNPVPDQPGKVAYVGQRKIGEVFRDLYHYLKQENILPEEYFLLNHSLNEEDDFPRCDFECYAQWGGSEGIYLEVVLITYEENCSSKRIPFATGKTLSETSLAYDRMQYIAGRIYKAFCGEGFVPSRYRIIPSSKDNEITYDRLISKLEVECANFMRTEILHKQIGLAELSRKLGLMFTIFSVIKEPSTYSDLCAEKINELYTTENILEHICNLCGSVSDADMFEIGDIIASVPTLLNKSAEPPAEEPEPTENLYFGFSQVHRMKGENVLHPDFEDKITFGLYVRNGDCVSEASVLWEQVDGKFMPCFRIYDGGVKKAFLSKYLAVVDKLRGTALFTPMQLIEVLISQGFEDCSDDTISRSVQTVHPMPSKGKTEKCEGVSDFVRRIDTLKEKAEKHGAHLEHNLFDGDHLDCFWYDGKDYVTIEYRGYCICFDVCGDVLVTLVCDESIDEEGFVEISHRSGAEPLYFDKRVSKVLADDFELNQAKLLNDAECNSSNWINIVIVDIATQSRVSEPDASEYSNILDAVENAFEPCIRYIDKLIEEMKK